MHNDRRHVFRLQQYFRSVSLAFFLEESFRARRGGAARKYRENPYSVGIDFVSKAVRNSLHSVLCGGKLSTTCFSSQAAAGIDKNNLTWADPQEFQQALNQEIGA